MSALFSQSHSHVPVNLVSTQAVMDSSALLATKSNYSTSQLPIKPHRQQAFEAAPSMPITSIASPADHKLAQAAHSESRHHEHQPLPSPSIRTPSPPLSLTTPPAPPPSQPLVSRSHKVKAGLRKLQQQAFLNRGCLFVLIARFESDDEERTYATRAMLNGGAAINIMTRPIACILGLKPNPSLPEVVV